MDLTLDQPTGGTITANIKVQVRDTKQPFLGVYCCTTITMIKELDLRYK
jgi:hypothetical protein